MQLNPQQQVVIRELSHSNQGKIIVEILTDYINEIKDDCVNSKCHPDAAREAIGKLNELIGKFTVLGEDINPPGKNQFR